MLLSLPEVEEGLTFDKVAFKAGKKNFLFMGNDGDGYNVKLKLKGSLEEALEQSSCQAGTIYVGSNGWVELDFHMASRRLSRFWCFGLRRVIDCWSLKTRRKTGRSLSQALPV